MITRDPIINRTTVYQMIFYQTTVNQICIMKKFIYLTHFLQSSCDVIESDLK